MIDSKLRPVKDRFAATPARVLGRIAPPNVVTVLSLIACISAGVFAWSDMRWWALLTWILGRILDGLDGPIARLRGEANDFGGYLDIVGDTIGYAAVPIGVAASIDTRGMWFVASILLATFYVNAISWAYLSALLEKRGIGADKRGESTSAAMPPAVIEGAETIVFFSVFIAFPQASVWTFALMAALVFVGVVQRLISAHRLLQ